MGDANIYSDDPRLDTQVYNKTEILNKLIEPCNEINSSSNNTSKVTEIVRGNRNFVTGNIDKQDLEISVHRHHIATLLKSIPSSKGGFLFNEIGNILDNMNNVFFIMSNSVDGRGRLSLVTNIIKSDLKEKQDKAGIGQYFNNGDKQ